MSNIRLTPVNISDLEVGKYFAWNKAFIDSLPSKSLKEWFVKRFSCIMVVKCTVLFKGKITKELVCTRQVCNSRHPTKLGDSRTSDITKDSLIHSSVALGNMLLKLETKFCHACGKFSYCVLPDNNCHWLCVSCLNGTLFLPFQYGNGQAECCIRLGCGKKAVPYKDKYLRVLLDIFKLQREESRKSL